MLVAAELPQQKVSYGDIERKIYAVFSVFQCSAQSHQMDSVIKFTVRIAKPDHKIETETDNRGPRSRI